MPAELPEQADGHHQTAQVGDDPGRIAHDLKHGGPVVVVETRLIKRHAVVAQRVVHKDQHFAVLAAVGGDEADAAGKVLRDLGAGVAVVGEVEQRERVGLVGPLEAQAELPPPAGGGERVGLGEHGRHEEGAEARAFGRDDLHQRGGQVALVHLVGLGQRRDGEARAEALVGRVFHRALAGGGLLAHHQRGVRVVGAGDDPEGQGVGGNGFGAGEVALRDDRDDLLVRLGDVRDGELVEAPAFGVVSRLALIQSHLVFLLVETGEQFAEQQKNKAGVDELDAGLFPSDDEAFRVGGDEIYQEQTADEVSAREDGDGEAVDFVQNDEAFEPFLLHRPDAEMNLVQGREEHQQRR